MEMASATLIGRYHDRIRGADCPGVSHLAYDLNAGPVRQEKILQQVLLRPINGASLVEMAEHANHDRV